MHLSRQLVSRIASPCIALGFALALATPALAVTKSWTTGNGFWSVAGNWSPVGAPALGDAADIGSHAGAANSIVTMDQSDTVAMLTITDGMTLWTASESLQVNGTTQVSGKNIVGPSTFASHLRVHEGVLGHDFATTELTLSDFGQATLENGADILVSGIATIGSDSLLTGSGTIDFTRPLGSALVNNGGIIANAGLLRFAQNGVGQFDLDGLSGNSVLAVGEGAELRFDGTALTDAFGSTIEMELGSTLTMNFSSGWTASNGSSIIVTGQPSGLMLAPAVLRGDPVTFAGNLEVTGASGNLHVESEATLATTLVANVNVDGALEFHNDAEVLGGDYNIADSADLIFHAATTVAGGTFSTSGVAAGSGRVNFLGETVWQGTVTLNGRSHQIGDATVAATTVINADLFDMDGNLGGSADWDVNAGLIINADQIDTSSANDFDSVINIGGGIANKLTINLTNPAHEWRLDGVMNLSSSLPGLFFTRVAGSRMVVHGDVNVINADVDLAADVEFHSGSSVNLSNAGSDLRFSGAATIASGTTFTGQGRILNNGDQMEIGNGVSLGQAGLVNNGTLHVGVDGAPAQAFVDRFASDDEARLEVAVGGVVPGTELSHLIVTGGTAQVDGILAPMLIDDGGSLFAPDADDVFTIITAPGGVMGTFDSLVQPLGLPTGLLFEVAYSANSVSLYMDSTYEADFDRDGDVDNADYGIWKGAFGLNNFGDANGDFVSDAADYTVWRDQLGSGLPMMAGSGAGAASAAPEPGTLMLAALTLLGLSRKRHGWRKRPISSQCGGAASTDR